MFATMKLQNAIIRLGIGLRATLVVADIFDPSRDVVCLGPDIRIFKIPK
jgi:hypothetical protein